MPPRFGALRQFLGLALAALPLGVATPTPAKQTNLCPLPPASWGEAIDRKSVV